MKRDWKINLHGKRAFFNKRTDKKKKQFHNNKANRETKHFITTLYLIQPLLALPQDNPIFHAISP
jgi:hypothetical protein